MAQITGAIGPAEFQIDSSTDGSSWTDRSGTITKITPSGGGRAVGSANTFDGDVPIVTSGKLSPVTLVVDFIYTEGASDLFEIVRALHQTASGTAFYLRWSPKGLDSGEFSFTTTAGRISEFKWPEADAAGSGPVMGQFTLIVPSITKAVV